MIGSSGQMIELRRSRSGPFFEETAVKLQDLRYAAYYYFEEKNQEFLDKIVSPIESALTHLPFVVIRDSAIDAICHGASLTAPGVVIVSSDISEGSLIVVKSLKDEAVALSRATKSTNEILQATNGVMADTDRVLMLPGTYPKAWKTHKKQESGH